MKKNTKIGLVGGAGPMAGALLFSKIIQNYQSKKNAWQDEDFPEIILLSYPFSQMLSGAESAGNASRLQTELRICLAQLRDWGCDRIVIACNTLHAFAPSDGFINMPAAIMNEADRRSLHPSAGAVHANHARMAAI